jgi:hypothetical protein
MREADFAFRASLKETRAVPADRNSENTMPVIASNKVCEKPILLSGEVMFLGKFVLLKPRILSLVNWTLSGKRASMSGEIRIQIKAVNKGMWP